MATAENQRLFQRAAKEISEIKRQVNEEIEREDEDAARHSILYRLLMQRRKQEAAKSSRQLVAS